MADYRWIDRAEDLVAAAEGWRAAGEIAVDTEFVFERTFRPQLGLIQVAGGGDIALVDPRAVGDLAPLAAVLRDAATRKLLHAASGDVAVLRLATGEVPAPLLDTQVAAAFAGLGAGLSYAALVRELLAIDLPKHETRTDWLRRPLSAEQLRYAAEDVLHLPPVAAELERRLAALGRLDWALEESARLAIGEESPAPDEAWRRHAGRDGGDRTRAGGRARAARSAPAGRAPAASSRAAGTGGRGRAARPRARARPPAAGRCAAPAAAG
ncbi:MAG: ribonuclease D, partial [Thermoanaerobaculia bacterium]|nr:ribonuclease D [Thermoanaerobaculia bacterium]